MKYCTKLFRDLNFEPDSIQPCCDVRKVQIPRFHYTGGPVDMEAYTRHIQNVCDNIQKDGPICKGCPDLKSSGEPMTCGMQFKAISINMHRYACNCRCTYCPLWQHPEKGIPYSVLPGLRSLHEGGFLDKRCAISWGGGEPSILPEFEETVKWGAENLYWQHIHTNAIKFSPTVAALLNIGFGHINVSLDSGSADVYRQVKGVSAWQKVTDNLRQYCRHGNPENVTLKYIVFEANNKIGEIEKFLLLCGELGIKEINYSLNFVETNSGKVSDNTLTAAAYLKKRAQDMGIKPVPFYLDKPWLAKIDKLASSL